MTKRILILGAGIGGIASANELAKKLGKKHEIVIVDRSEHYEFSPSYLWILSGARKLAQIRVPLARVSRRGLRFERGAITAIDAVNRTVSIDGRVLETDYLLIALGATTHMTGLEEVAKRGHDLYTAQGSQAVAELSRSGVGGRHVVLVASMPFKCPAAPYEAAMLWQASWKRNGKQSTFAIYTPEPGPMPVAGEKVSARLTEMLKHKGIEYFPKHAIKGMDAAGKLDFGERVAGFDYLAYVPKHSVPQLLVEAGLAASGGWAAVDRYTMRTKFPNVYAVGDCVGIPLANGKALPKAGVFAHGQAEVAARNIAAEIAGQTASHRFDGRGQCFVEMGNFMAGRGAGNFYAEPNPDVHLAMPGPWNHLGKVVFEKYWLNFMY